MYYQFEENAVPGIIPGTVCIDGTMIPELKRTTVAGRAGNML
jgi:hypothetical protein